MVGLEGGGASFAQKCFGLGADNDGSDSAEWIGTVVLPGAPSSGGGSADTASTTAGLGDSLDPADPLNSACNIFYRKRAGAEKKVQTEAQAGGEKEAQGPSSNGVEESGGKSNGSSANGVPGDDDSNATTNSDDGDGDGDGVSSFGGDGVAVVLCGYRVPPRQANAWAKALLGGIDADVVVALTTVAAEPGRSEGWQGARLLATAEAEEREDCLKVSRARRREESRMGSGGNHSGLRGTGWHGLQMILASKMPVLHLERATNYLLRPWGIFYQAVF